MKKLILYKKKKKRSTLGELMMDIKDNLHDRDVHLKLDAVANLIFVLIFIIIFYHL